jgi:hypothetical protein
MKAKSLLIAAATRAVGAITSQAQGYSQNVVGYVNLTVTNNGFSQFTTPVDFDGTGTNNLISSVLGTNLPVGALVETWNGTSFTLNNWSIPKGKTAPVWSNPNQVLNPGLGFFVKNPSNSVMTVTVVGTVLQGSFTNQYLNSTPGNFSMIGSQYPVAANLTGGLGYKPSPGDTCEIFNQANSGGLGSYSIYNYNIAKGQTTNAWHPNDPLINVGQGFFIITTNKNTSMTSTFVVQ